MRLGVKLLDPKAVLPEYQHTWDSGMDLSACIEEDLILYPNVPEIVGTGLSFEIPSGYEVQIRPRSGLACKFGVTVVNAPGTIDSGYTGEIKVGLINLSNNPYKVSPGDRIAQAVPAEVTRGLIQLINNLGTTSRGDGGLGSTGA